MNRRLIVTRITHWLVVALTTFNLLLVDRPSCCCADSSSACQQGAASCCGEREGGVCGCCCRGQASEEDVESSCPLCAAKETSKETSSKDVADGLGSPSCNSSGACDCGAPSAKSAIPGAAHTSRPSVDDFPVAFVEVETPRIADLRPAVSFELRNALVASLDPSVSIRFGVWRN